MKEIKTVILKIEAVQVFPPYELFLPSSGPGVTGRGIPNSVSI